MPSANPSHHPRKGLPRLCGIWLKVAFADGLQRGGNAARMVRLPLAGVIFLMLAQISTATVTQSRLWSRVTPAAGVQIRSAPTFRAYAISSSGSPSVDIYQTNTDGSSTKLDTLVASTAGVYSAGTYSTKNMAAIYWQFTTLPAASSNPPPVTVTFINDTPAVALSAMYPNGLPQTPFAATDPSLLLNLDFRNGAPAGWSNYGSGSFDPTNGYLPGTASANGIANVAVPVFASGSPLPSGTVAVRFQRTGVATDDSFGSNFWDSTGNTLNATTKSRQLFQMRANSGTAGIAAAILAAPIPFLQISLETPSMTTADHFNWQTMNSHYTPGYQDPTFADLMVTWFQNQYYVFFDGHLVSAGTLGDVPSRQMLQNICVGNYNGTGLPSGAPFGSYYIQQFQVSTRFLGPVLAGPTIGLIPDSFAAAYTQRASPTPTGAGGTYQVSDINAVQNALGLYTGMAPRTTQPGQTATFHQIQALMFQNYGFFPPIYDAGESGHGYSSINAPMDDAFMAALNAATPSVVMAGGTVNDVSPFTPSDANLVADTEGFMRRLVLGGGAKIAVPANPLLEQIIYLETLSSQSMPNSGPYPEPAYGSESQNIISITRAGLPGFVPPNGTVFDYITSREWWNQAANYDSYLYGSNPANPYTEPGGGDYLNVHPDATGYSVIAAHLFPPIASAIMNTAGADVSLKVTGSESGSGLLSYSLTVANAGPLTSTGGIITATLPSGASLVTGSSASGCSQSGQVVSCVLGSVAAGSSATVALTIQAAKSASMSITFALAGGAVYDPNSSNNSVNLTVLPTSSGAVTDGPIPMWALALLALSFLGIATRQFKPSA
jgi:uncharacterized repeat protein (TIGR01451 family)